MKSALVASRRFGLIAALAAALNAAPHQAAVAQAVYSYQQVEGWAQLPAGTTWQDMMAVDTDSKGNIYALQRTPFKVMVFNAKGRFLRSWGEELKLPRVHGLRIDRQDNVWITDRKYHQVLKFTRDGTPLMALGTKEVAGDNDSTTALNGPADVAFAPNGDIFVADGEGPNTRIVKFAKDGSFLKYWGTKGSGSGQLLIPHGIVMDARGRLLVANRGNKRVEIFDQNGAVLGQIANITSQNGIVTPYGLDLARDGTLYITDGTKGSESLTVLDMRNDKVLANIPHLNGSHMLAVDRRGAVYVAEVRGLHLRKFVRK